jgi:ring-1,2-phenylacetyl-CoA epoxidase subunit PaaE
MLLTLPIDEVIRATPRARMVRLDLGDHAFAYDAGQAVMIAPHGSATRKPYSISSAPEDARRFRRLELLVGTDASGTPDPPFVPEVGALIDVDGPFGTFVFPHSPNERRFLFVAGGTGIAPLHAMLCHALVIPHDSIGLLYSARTADDFAYAEELSGYAREGRIELRQTVTRSAAKDWSGMRGRMTRDTLAHLVHDPATLCFVCGPPAMVEEVTRMLQELGVGRERIRTEWA